MGNMSYVRFQNTLDNLKDCAANMEEKNCARLNEYEDRARQQLIGLCLAISARYGQDSAYDESQARWEERIQDFEDEAAADKADDS